MNLFSLALLLLWQITAQVQPAKVEVSAELDKSSYAPGELVYLKILVFNDSPKAVRVPIVFRHVLGPYPSVRVSFRTADGREEFGPSAEAWPNSRTLPTDYLEKSIELRPRGIHGSAEPIGMPRQIGCYQMKVYFYSWTVPTGPFESQAPIMLGDYESPNYKVCIRPPTAKSKSH
jgi:hypothetical protein